ncbi:MAG: TatD family hydrolase [Dysosmobacter sp.]
MLFDTHAHYDDEAFDPDRREVLAGLPQKGVGLVVDPGCTLTSSEKAVALAAEFPHVYAAVGLHPENCHDFQPEQIERLRQLAQREKVVAIGEVGLDYYWEENPPRASAAGGAAARQLALAEELKCAVIFHDREAHGDSLAIVREFPAVRGVPLLSGSVEMAEELLKLGWMLSFNGAITFKNARKAPEVIAAVPLERMMVETDASYLTPVPFRGKRNDSGYVHLVAEKIAQLKGLPAEQVERQTWENGVRFFGIPQE